MNWKGIAGIVGKAAPLLGMLIGGPAGGAIGGLIANALGTKATPGAIKDILTNDASAKVKLKELELSHEADLQRMALEYGRTSIAQVNETMRVEAQSGHWWVSAWRPFWGFTSALAFFAQAGAVAYLLTTKGDPALIAALASLSVFWTVPLAVVGVTAHGRSNEKIAKLTGVAPKTIWGAFAERIGGKK